MPRSVPSELVAFCRELRAAGISATPARAVDAARSLELIESTDQDAFHTALRANLTVSVDEFEAFDVVYERFWLGKTPVQRKSARTPNMTTIENQPQGPPVYALVRAALEGMSPEGDARLPGGDHTAGDTDILTRKDFRDYTATDVPRARRLIQRLAPALATARSRRFESATSGAVDIRRTVRGARRNGGEVVRLAFRQPRLRKLRVVALCDVSGSMDVYSNHLLQFCYALQQQSGGVRTFVFSTRVRDVSQALRRKRFQDVLAGLSAEVDAWSGGTTIGACLREFNTRWAKELVGPRTVVIIASDGWERGDPAELRAQMKRLRQRARRIIWLNPLKARDGYEPLAAGMSAALPFVDDFLPAESLRSLERLTHVLARA